MSEIYLIDFEVIVGTSQLILQLSAKDILWGIVIYNILMHGSDMYNWIKTWWSKRHGKSKR